MYVFACACMCAYECASVCMRVCVGGGGEGREGGGGLLLFPGQLRSVCRTSRNLFSLSLSCLSATLPACFCCCCCCCLLRCFFLKVFLFCCCLSCFSPLLKRTVFFHVNALVRSEQGRKTSELFQSLLCLPDHKGPEQTDGPHHDGCLA